MNPIGLLVTAIGLLVVGLVIAYKKSDTFRAIVQAAFRAAASVVLAAVSGILSAFEKLFSAASHIPGIGGAMSSVAGASPTPAVTSTVSAPAWPRSRRRSAPR